LYISGRLSINFKQSLQLSAGKGLKFSHCMFMLCYKLWGLRPNLATIKVF